jgi:hypothetical protein
VGKEKVGKKIEITAAKENVELEKEVTTLTMIPIIKKLGSETRGSSTSSALRHNVYVQLYLDRILPYFQWKQKNHWASSRSSLLSSNPLQSHGKTTSDPVKKNSTSLLQSRGMVQWRTVQS